MVSFDDVLTQFLQPYFSYSLVFLAISFVCIKIFLRFNSYLDRRTRSIFWLIPLFIPVLVLTVFRPGTIISMLPPLQTSLSPPIIPPMETAFEKMISPIEVPSITGILCLAGLIAATVYFAVTMVFGHRIAARVFHVIMLSPEEYRVLQEKVHEISQKIGISTPKVGLVEDLRPNAFTLGYGRRTVLVFSLGLLNMLDLEELAAVVSHELAHVKANDCFFKSLSYSLSMISFFNPLSYFAVSESQKERELLADERGAKVLGQPRLMANVLTKIGRALQSFPKEHLAVQLSSNLFLVSPLARRPQILAAHPQIAHRVHNIDRLSLKPTPKSTRIIAVVAVSCVLILASVIAGYSMMSFQTAFLQEKEMYMFVCRRSTEFNTSLENSFTLPMETWSTPTSAIVPSLSQFNADLSLGDVNPVLNASDVAQGGFEGIHVVGLPPG
jgi:heat shock protein HtpX